MALEFIKNLFGKKQSHQKEYDKNYKAYQSALVKPKSSKINNQEVSNEVLPKSQPINAKVIESNPIKSNIVKPAITSSDQTKIFLPFHPHANLQNVDSGQYLEEETLIKIIPIFVLKEQDNKADFSQNKQFVANASINSASVSSESIQFTTHFITFPPDFVNLSEISLESMGNPSQDLKSKSYTKATFTAADVDYQSKILPPILDVIAKDKEYDSPTDFFNPSEVEGCVVNLNLASNIQKDQLIQIEEFTSKVETPQIENNINIQITPFTANENADPSINKAEKTKANKQKLNPFSKKERLKQKNQLKSQNLKLLNSQANAQYEQKIDKILHSIGQLFGPFKDIIIKTMPFTKSPLAGLDKLSRGIGKIIKVIVVRFPTFMQVLRSIYFKILIGIIIILFLSGAIFSRFINSPTYIQTLEKSIYQTSGYRANINGAVKINFIPSLAMALNNVNFYIDDSIGVLNKNKKDDNFKISKFETERLLITFKFLPLLWGKLEVKSAHLNQAVIDVKILGNANQPVNKNYQNIIYLVEKSISNQENYRAFSDDSSVSLGEGRAKSLEDYTLKVPAVLSLQTELNDKAQDLQYENQAALALMNLTRNESFTYKLFSTITKNLKFNFQDLKSLKISRGKVNIVNAREQKILIIDNVSSQLQAKFGDKFVSEGNFRLMDVPAIYKLEVIYNQKTTDFNFALSLNNDLNQGIIAKGQKNNDNSSITGDLAADYRSAALFIDKFLTPLSLKASDDYSFHSSFLVRDNSLLLNKINLKINDTKYSGKLFWDFSTQNNSLDLDLTIQTPNIDNYFKGINKQPNNVQAKSTSFISFVNYLDIWKTGRINNFRLKNFRANLNIQDTTLNNKKINRIDISFLVNNYNIVYIDKLMVKTPLSDLIFRGKIDLSAKTATLTANTSGTIADTGELIGFNSNAVNFLTLIGKKKNNYDLKAKISFDTNRAIVNSSKGYIGERNIDNSYGIFLQRTNNSDLIITSHFAAMNLGEISDLYVNQLGINLYERNNEINVFGIPETLLVKLNIKIDNFSHKGLKFKDATLEVDLTPGGFGVKNFQAQGEDGGFILASLNLDTKVTPAFIGHINLENIVMKLEKTQDLFFTDKHIIGNVVLNGRLRFSSENYKEPFKKIDGEIAFIKQERLKLSRYANTDGLYMTISEKSKGKEKTFFINDLYGKANIINNKLDFYPVALLYILNGKEYRGTFEGSYDMGADNLKTTGVLDSVENTNNKINFSIDSNITKPVIKQTFIKGKLKPKVMLQVPVIEENDKTTYGVSNNLNDTQDKGNFNNAYNLNIKAEQKQLMEEIFSEALKRGGESSENNADPYSFKNYQENNQVKVVE
ncbi:putative AsmA-like C-terminal containing protein [Candidatus Hepatincolaceae symbiont of Richtersius coronifer]